MSLPRSTRTKRWAILACPFGTARQRSSHADKTAPVSSSATCGTRLACGEGEGSTASRLHPCQRLPNDDRLNTNQTAAVPSLWEADHLLPRRLRLIFWACSCG